MLFALAVTAGASAPKRSAALEWLDALAAPKGVVLPPGAYGPHPWMREWPLSRPMHVSAIRARFASTTSGVPIRYRWELRACESETFTNVEGASDHQEDPTGLLVLPRRRTWFVDVPGRDACAVRLVVLGTNGGVPTIDDLEMIEGARDVMREATAEEDPERALNDGQYETAWSGAERAGRWTVTLRLPRAERIDRIRMMLGSRATTVARPGLGRNYAVARAPQRWSLEVSDDGTTYSTIARGRSPLVRRPFVRLTHPRPVIAVRLVMEGSTDDLGMVSSTAAPIVRELAAYAQTDARPVISEPWILSVNANPAASSRKGTGGEVANDAYFAKFLQLRFGAYNAGVARDDRFTRSLGGKGELVAVDATPSDGRALESIEGDDPALTEAFLTASWPPPISVLSGSNDWEYARHTTPDMTTGTTKWNPLLPAQQGGMGDLADAVKHRAAPFVGFCGGAQILALLESRSDGSGREIDAVLRRNTGRPIRGFAPESSLIRAWPGETRLAPRVTFDKSEPLFADLAFPSGRSATRAFPQSHLDLVRPDAFAPGAPLSGFRVVATSLFCSPVVVASLNPMAFEKNPSGTGRCSRVTEVFRSKGTSWPIIGAQFHAEQRDYAQPPPGDPPEAVADARLFVAAAYEEILDSYLGRR